MNRFVLYLTAIALACFAQAPPKGPSPAASEAVEKLLDRVVERERALVASMKQHTPMVETYIQETPAAAGGDVSPNKDHYFLGRLHVDEELTYDPLIERTDSAPKQPSRFGLKMFGGKAQPVIFLPRGFAQMAFIDVTDFSRANYKFDYVRREFLGDVRCLVFDVTPRNPTDPGRFTGRIWVEDRENAIVRFDGIYVQPPPTKGAPPERYFHFDSWRVNVAAGEWAPAQIYVEEAGDAEKGPTAVPRFKAQTRLWDYAATPVNKLDELTNVLIEEAGVKDQAAAQDVSPLESQRSWERQAEENILARLEKGGFLAPAGAVDEVLNTVVNNLIVSANLNVEAHCRVLLTTPVETFSIGHTIVISRGLIDVLPDEVSLALVLADELSHIALGHRTQTQFAFHSQTMLSDAQLLQKFHFERTKDEMAAAGRKTVEIIKASPYQQTSNAGVFLKALASRGQALPRLLAANMGNQVADHEALARLAEFAATAPALEENKIEQIAALPLGSRVKLNPWNNQILLVKSKPLSLLSPREKMPFEVTPFALHLTRIEATAGHE